MCCVDLGVHLDFLPVVAGGIPARPEAMSVTECEIRKRLTPNPDFEDFWWAYHDPHACEDVLAALQTRGLPFFEQFQSFPTFWQSISVDDLRTGKYGIFLPGLTTTRAALLLARLHACLGDQSRCRAFAEFGLEVVPAIATGPTKALKELLSKTGGRI